MNAAASLSVLSFSLAALAACGARSPVDDLSLSSAAATAGAGGSGGASSSTSNSNSNSNSTSGSTSTTGGSGGSPTPGYVSVACGGDHLCAATTGGQVLCWGFGGRGQLGDGLATGFAKDPVAAAGIEGASAVAAGGEHTCALAQGTVYCWGHDEYGQIGDGQSGVSVQRNTPFAVPLPGPATAITAGGYHFGGGHSCALLKSGDVWCWGADTGGQLGDGKSGFGVFVATPIPVPVGGPAVAVAAGGMHTCALLTTGAVSCWGYDANGQVGDGKSGENVNTPFPAAVLELPDKALTIAAGDAQSCAILAGGQPIFCWGLGGFGAFGTGAAQDAPKPTYSFPGGGPSVSVDMGAVHGCIVRSAGDVECAGLDDLGEVGSDKPGPFEIHATPVLVPIHDAIAISTGTTTSCALRQGGKLSCWGEWLGPLPVEMPLP